MFKRVLPLLLLGVTGCATTGSDGVRYLTASTGQQAMKMRSEVAACKLIEREGEKTDIDTKFRRRAVQYGADTLLLIRTTTFEQVNFWTTSVEGDTPSSQRAERPEFAAYILAEYYKCDAKP